MPIQEQKPLFTSLLFRCLLCICLTSILATNSSFAEDTILDIADHYDYLSKDEVNRIHKRLGIVNGWAKIGNNRYMNFNTLKWKSFIDVFYQIKVNTPDSDRYDYYVESNHIDCVGGIRRLNQTIEYYKDGKVMSSEDNFKPVDYLEVSEAQLTCEKVKGEYLTKELELAKQRLALTEKTYGTKD